MKTYVINLPKDSERKAFQEKQLQGLNIDYEIIHAISTNDISKQAYQKHKYDWQRPLRDVEVACYYSHQILWKKIIKNEEPALILEDDALLSPYMPSLIKELSSLKNIDYINLEVVGRKKIVSKKAQKLSSCDAKLYRLYLDRNGAGGYILFPSGAKKLLVLEAKSGIGLSDAHINACTDLISYQIEPASVIQLDQCAQYGITPPLDIKSNIGTQEKPTINLKERWLFVPKRLKAQFKQGLQHLFTLLKAEKREIKIRLEDFVSSYSKEQKNG